MDKNEDREDSSIKNYSTQSSIEIDKEPSVSKPLVKTDMNTEVIVAPSSKDMIYKNVKDTSIDSGIQDVESKGESGVDEEYPTSTVDQNLDTNAEKMLELSRVKEVATNEHEENGKSTEDIIESNDKDISDICDTESVSIVDNCIYEKNVCKISFENVVGMQDKANVNNSDNISKESASVVNDLDKDKPVKSVDFHKDMDVEEKKKPGTESDDVKGENLGTVMMEYRSTEKVNAVEGSSDSSPDSSDSDDNGETSGTKDTEAQLNKIISSERDASPEREKRVKLNRYGFEDIRTKGELLPEDLPPLEELTITVDESVVMVEVGSIKSIVGILVVIQSNENVPPLDDETILFVKGHKVLGQVFEVFGPVRTPWYSVRFNELNNIEAKGLEVGMPVYCAPREDSFTKFVFVDSLKRVKGSDASWEDNNEPPEKHLDYSDDESERRAKAKRRNKKFGDETQNGEDGESAVQRKNPRQRNRNRPNRENHSELEPQQHTQHPKRGWNPFKGNQNENSNSGPPRYGGRHQDNQNNSHSNGQRWPHGQNNFNRPQSRFGGPPNFQDRPRMGQNQAQIQYRSRNIQHQNSWRPPSNNFQNNMQNSSQNSFNGPPPSNNSFNMQGIPPPMVTGFGPRQVLSPPPAPINVNFSQPPPQFQHCNPVRPPNQPTGANPWVGQQVGMPQQNAPFIATKLQNQSNQSLSQGSQSINQQQINVGNQMYSQGQPVSSTSFQSNQSNTTLPGNAPLQSSMGNFPNYAMNNGQNTFNQPHQNSFQPSQPSFQTHNNFSGPSNISSNDPGMGGLNGGNFVPSVSGSVQFAGTNPVSCNSQPSNTNGPNFANFPMQNIPGQTGFNNVRNSENNSLVQNQNLINNQHHSSGNQIVPLQGYGFQSNIVGQNQPAGQGGFNRGTSGSYPYSGSNLMSNGDNAGFN